MRFVKFCGRDTAAVALGTMDFGGRIDEGRARDFMDAYLDIGGNFIDTARMYGDFAANVWGGSEEVIGRWLNQHRRDEIVLSTKGAHPKQKGVGRLNRAEVMEDMQRSLDALKCGYVDIYWLHRDDESRPVRDIMETLTELCERGYTKYVGVSNWKTERITEANACAEAHGLVKLYANQPQFSLAPQYLVEDPTLCQMDKNMYAMHMQNMTPCVAFSSQSKGYLAKMAQEGESALNDKVRRRFHTPENTALLERVKALSEETGLSVPAIALAWLTNQPFPTFPIAGVSRTEHFAAIKEAGDAVLTDTQLNFLRKM